MEKRGRQKDNAENMKGLKKLDYYIMKKFILTFFAAILLIIGIVIIIDISEKIGDFVAKEAPIHAIIFDYYLNFIPYFMNMYSPLFVFITVIFFTSRMAADSEIVAILSCGVSYHRLMVPYLLSALLIASLSLGLSLWVIPHSNEVRLEFENQFVKRRSGAAGRNIHYKLSDNKFVYVESFSVWNNTAYGFSLETVENDRMLSKISAESAVWDSLSGSWRLKNYFIREYGDGLYDRVTQGSQIDTVLELSVEDFRRSRNTVEELPQKELNALIKVQKGRGDANVMYAQIELHTRFALPFSAFILTIIGVALSSRKRRGGTGWNIGIGIALGFSYILFLRFSQMFVYTGFLPPGIALWLPNVIFAMIAVVIYRLAPK